ncbi:MAG: glycosyltransferase family 39 protein [Desulfobacterales bacterium]|nr:glycosyltransferase family 39 protein [Desulfobacterales bacterium]
MRISGYDLTIQVFKKHFVFFFIITIVGLSIFLRFYGIDDKDVWLDEANAILISEKTAPEIVNRLASDASPLLFYFILHYWMKLFGQSETALRAISTFFGVLLVITLFFIGRKLFTTQTGIYAALIAAIAPIQVMYSQQVRMYTLLPLMGILSMYFLVSFIHEGKKSQICWYIISTIACIYTHNYGLLLFPAHTIMMFCYARHRKTLILWLIGLGCIFLVYSLWLPTFIGQFDNIPTNDWRNHFWNRFGFAGSLLQSLKSFSPGGTQLPFVPLNAISWQPILPVFLSAILLLSGSSPLIKKKQPAKHKTMVVWLIVYVTIPLISAAIISSISSSIYLAGRCDQLVFPGFCLLVAAGINNIKPKYLQYAAVVVFAMFSLKTLDEYYKGNPKHGDKLIATTIRQHLMPGDAILCTSLTRASLEYYLRDKKLQNKFFSFPAGTANHMADQDNTKLLEDPVELFLEAESLEKEIRSKGSQSGRFFVVFVPNQVNKILKEQITRNITADQVKLLGRFKQSLLAIPVQVVLINYKSGNS